LIPKAVEHVIAELSKLPGIGRRSAERLAFDLLNRAPERPAALADALARLAEGIAPCTTCFFYAEDGVCPICSDPRRDAQLLCVVETPMDVTAFDRVGGMRPLFHVLGGRLSPLKGITPDDLHIDALLDRIREGIEEVILATSPTVEGEATALYLASVIGPLGARMTRIGRGIPMGGSLEHADAETLRLSLETRRAFSS
jgi:recombination protein RecR